MDKDLEFAVPFAGALLLMFLYVDFLVQVLWIAAWAAVRYKFRYKFVKDSNVEQN
ncbi:MAG: hypothetical protein HYW27_04070 [Candidatus Aenigmarchaeota archaeon]|nr:hypothetical protein [Candidatus Aenigmarchaeota archaeon]